MHKGLIAGAIGIAASVGLGSTECTNGDNAALEYYRAWLFMDSEIHLGLLSDDDEFALSDDAEERLDDSQVFVGMLIDASESGDADWDVSYEDGPGAVLPHLGQLRASARVIGADAIRCMDAGDSNGAATRIATLFRMGDDVTGDRILISSLVGMAIGNEATKLANHYLDHDKLGANAAGSILSAIRECTHNDRYAMREAIIGEWRIMSEFIVRQSGQDAGKNLIETVMLEPDSGPAKEVYEMDRADLLRSLGGLAAYYGDLLDAWDSGELDQMLSVEKQIEAGDYGPLTELFGASLTRAFDSDRQLRRQIDDLTDRLEKIAD